MEVQRFLLMPPKWQNTINTTQFEENHYIIIVIKKNMKNILLTFILLFSCHVLRSQNIDKINKSDTLYIYFKASKKQLYEFYYSKQNKKIEDYYFLFSGNNTHDSSNIIFGRTDRYQKRKEKKSFLKLNKDHIITFEFLTQFDLNKAIRLIDPVNKKLYIIDEKDFKWGKILLKEVKATSTLQLED